jgi:hypothetical protein
MLTVSTNRARGGVASPSHRVLKILILSLCACLLSGLLIIAFV